MSLERSIPQTGNKSTAATFTAEANPLHLREGEAPQVETVTMLSFPFEWRIPRALLISDDTCNQQNSFIF